MDSIKCSDCGIELTDSNISCLHEDICIECEKENSICSNCGEEMTWCNICQVYSSYCCIYYGTSACSLIIL